MQIATDATTDSFVHATNALAWRRFRCPRCHADVILKAGASNVAHFAHAKGEADPACENYFSSVYKFTGSQSRFSVSNLDNSTRDIADLFFEVGVSGTRLLMWLPAAGEASNWPGTLQVEAYQVTRRLTCQHLMKGQFVPFELFDGQWQVAVEGDVPESYLANLSIGTGSLGSGLNVFDASRTPGRRLGPSAPIRLGDSYWLIVRSTANLALQSSGLATWEEVPSTGGWTVYYITTPADDSAAVLDRLSSFFQRPVAPARVRVWIERPWPIMMRDGYLPVLEASPLGMEIRADRPVDMEVRPIAGGQSRIVAKQTLCARWQNMELGQWEIRINGQRYSNFEVAEGGTRHRALIIAQFDNLAPVDLIGAQHQLERLANSNTSPKQIHIRWDNTAITSLLRVNGLPVRQNLSTMSFVLAAEPALEIDAENLGRFTWSNPVEEQIPHIKEFIFDYAAAARAKWLLSVARHRNGPGSIRIIVPDKLRMDPTFRRLHGLWLPAKYAPHINVLLAATRTRS